MMTKPDQATAQPEPTVVCLPASKKLSLALLVVAIAVPFITAILNYEFWNGALPARYNVVSPWRIEQVSGDFAWRFFEWHILGGNGVVTSVDRILVDLGFSLSAAQNVTGIIDFGNPTPFHIFVILVGIAMLLSKPRRFLFGRRIIAVGYLCDLGAFLLFPIMFGVMGIICGVLTLKNNNRRHGLALIAISAILVILFIVARLSD
jgi:hypothetical protein